jgi:hypothetical protein
MPEREKERKRGRLKFKNFTVLISLSLFFFSVCFLWYVGLKSRGLGNGSAAPFTTPARPAKVW